MRSKTVILKSIKTRLLLLIETKRSYSKEEYIQELDKLIQEISLKVQPSNKPSFEELIIIDLFKKELKLI